MTIHKLFNLAKVASTTTGTGDVTLGSAKTGFLTFADAGVSDGDVVSYGIKDGDNVEIGRGTYSSTGPKLARTSILKSTNGGDPLNLSGTDVEVFIGPLAEDFDVTGNLAGGFWLSSDVAAAATCDIGAATSPIVKIAGTTTITSFGTKTNRLRRVHFNGVLTLTHDDTTLVLPGSANITTAAGDEAEFVSDSSGNWRCTKYPFHWISMLDAVVGTQAKGDNSTKAASTEYVDRITDRGIPAFTGQIATRCRIPVTASTDDKQFMCRTRHVAMDDITSLSLVYANWYVNTTNKHEEDLGDTIDVTAGIEYPVGTITQVLFDGVATGTIAAGDNIVSDAASVIIPKGEEFWVRSYQSSDTGIVFQSWLDLNAGEAGNYGASGIDDLTTGGTISNMSTGAAFAPVAIIGETTTPAVFLLGDSRVFGNGDVLNAAGAVGNFERIFSPQNAVINSGVAGDKAVIFAANGTKRLALANDYCSHVVIQMGINDIRDGQTAAQIKTDTETIIAALTKPAYVATIEPKTTSSDSWATVENQTVDANNSVRTTLNASIRSGLAGAAGYIEFADIVETARDSGKWKVTGKAFGYTKDGVHSTKQGADTWQNSERIDPRVFYRAPDVIPLVASPVQVTEAVNAEAFLTPRSMARPAFLAKKNGVDQTGIPPATATAVTFPNVIYDRGGYFDATNSVWQPPAGFYCIIACLNVSGLVDQSLMSSQITKDGSQIAATFLRAGGSGNTSATVMTIAATDGSAKFGVAMSASGTGDKTVGGGANVTYFGGFAL